MNNFKFKFKFILIAIVCSLFILSLSLPQSALGNEKSVQQSLGQDCKYNFETQYRNCEASDFYHRGTSLNDLIQVLDAKQKEAKANDYAKDGLKTQKDMANAAWSLWELTLLSVVIAGIATVFVGVTVYFTYFANKAAWEAVKETRDIGRKQVRAYLGGSNKDFFGIFKIRTDRFFIRVPVKNFGQSPAENVVINNVQFIWDNRSSGNTNEGYDIDINLTIGRILPSGTQDFTLLINNRRNTNLLKDSFLDIIQQGKRFYVKCTISYEDVFQQTDTAEVIFYSVKFTQIKSDRNGNIVGQMTALNRSIIDES